MRIIRAVGCVLLVVCACSGGAPRPDEISIIRGQAAEWSTRESLCPDLPNPELFADTPDGKLIEIMASLTWLKSGSDQAIWGLRDHWETSCEAFEKGAADCEGIAHVIHRLARQAGIETVLAYCGSEEPPRRHVTVLYGDDVFDWAYRRGMPLDRYLFKNGYSVMMTYSRD